MSPGTVKPISALVRHQMRRQRRENTGAELVIRRALHSAGLRYRLQFKVPGAPRRTIDIAFPRQKIAIMVDGCFWHGCPLHCVAPKHNAQWWAEKLATNVRRDAETTELLTEAGWTVVRIWEHEPVADAVSRIREALGR